MYKFARETHTHRNTYKHIQTNKLKKKWRKKSHKLNGCHHHIIYTHKMQRKRERERKWKKITHIKNKCPYLFRYERYFHSINICLLLFLCASNSHTTTYKTTTTKQNYATLNYLDKSIACSLATNHKQIFCIEINSNRCDIIYSDSNQRAHTTLPAF